MISIDISSGYIYAIETSGNRKKLKLKSFCRFPLTEPVIKNEQVNTDYALKMLEKVMVGMRSKEVCLTISAATVVYNEYTLPYEKKDAFMRNMIWSNISRSLTADKYVMDYSVMQLFREDGAEKCRVCAYLMQRSVVKDFEAILLKLKKTPKEFDIAQNCIYKFCGMLLPETTAVLANIEKDQLKIHLFNAPDMILTRTTILDEARVYSPSRGEQEESPVLVSVADQISKMFQFQAIKQHDRAITAIYLFGALADEAAVGFIQERFDTKTTLLKVYAPMPGLKKIPVHEYAYCIGGVL